MGPITGKRRLLPETHEQRRGTRTSVGGASTRIPDEPDFIACRAAFSITSLLRLLHFQLGRCQIYLVTNVLNQKRLSDAQATRLYQLRWGVEVQFRRLKQTFGRRKVRSKTPERAKVELD